MADVRSHFLICTGGGCIASGALDVSEAVRAELKARELAGEVDVVETGCLGPCVQGPVALVYPDGVFYQNIKVDDVPEIVEEHLLKGRIVERLVSHAPGTDRTQAEMDDIPFFNRQVKIVLRNSGIIDPLNIDEYIARDGYQALAKVLTAMTPEQVVEEVLASGLRGRGGAGFPTGMKWRFAQQQDNDTKYILCNADEGDPGAFMDRSVLEGDPHSLIEGMVIGAFAIGAHQGYVYVRAEYPLAVERLEHALGQAREYGLLGNDIMGSGFDFDLEIRMGSGAFVCGEETALMTSIEGHRGEPRPRPPFPAVSGLWGKPSVLNNVETFANIAPIILKGAEWYASTGTESSKGTKVFALGGNVQHTGLVEVPIGMQLGELIYEVGGGIPNGKAYKAAQLGGPSGGCIPKEHLNVPVDYATLQELGAIMGSGGVIVMDEDTCMVDIARFFLEFTQEESCGKCPPCRVGTKRMLEIVERICQRRGRGGRHRAPHRPRRDHQPDRALRPRPDGGQPGAQHHPPLPPRVRGPHQGQVLRGRRLLDDVQGALLQRVPGQRQHPRLREPRGRGALRRGAQAAPRAQPAGQHLRPRLLPPLREQVHALEPRRRRSPSATSSASWSSRRRTRSCRRSWRTPRTRPARSPSSAPGPPASPPPTSSPGWATSRSCSRPSPRPAACSSRPSRPTACRAPSSSARSR